LNIDHVGSPSCDLRILDIRAVEAKILVTSQGFVDVKVGMWGEQKMYEKRLNKGRVRVYMYAPPLTRLDEISDDRLPEIVQPVVWKLY